MGIVTDLVRRQRREHEEEQQIALRMNSSKSATTMMLNILRRAVEQEISTFRRETGDLSIEFRNLANGSFSIRRAGRIPAFDVTVEIDPPHIFWRGFMKEASDNLQRDFNETITVVSPHLEEYFYRLDGKNRTEAEILGALFEPLIASVLHLESRTQRIA